MTTKKHKSALALRVHTRQVQAVLHVLADRLNDREGHGRHRDIAAGIVDAILEHPWPATVPAAARIAQNRFEAIAYATTTTENPADTARSAAAWRELLGVLMLNPRRDRLRRCPVCARWFVDETRNGRQRCCADKCGDHWSNALRKKRGRA